MIIEERYLWRFCVSLFIWVVIACKYGGDCISVVVEADFPDWMFSRRDILRRFAAVQRQGDVMSISLTVYYYYFFLDTMHFSLSLYMICDLRSWGPFSSWIPQTHGSNGGRRILRGGVKVRRPV
ncbi:hypothetical protein B0T24DRAFT_426654 [Lasiosphaeria ovina]|uniref:Uncharacterized protein n=1 Tax=Lasiosphaeria ovina TaxID=92902 RepID=A0AAE0JWD5_9PEZI|nr:hypothetical protein B0T24DRAFT_426654 [Lasiosphaeria ovina]